MVVIYFFLIYLVRFNSETICAMYILKEAVVFSNHRIIFFTSHRTIAFFFNFSITFSKLFFTKNEFISSNVYSLFCASPHFLKYIMLIYPSCLMNTYLLIV